MLSSPHRRMEVSKSKTKSQDRDTLKSPWLMSRDTLTKNCPFFGNLLSHILSLDRNDVNNSWTKNPFKTILTWEEMLQSERSSMICVVARSRQTMRTKKNWLSCHALEKKIRLSLNKNQEKKWWENDEKLHEHKSSFSCKELFFSLGNHIWNEKWPSFTIPSLM